MDASPATDQVRCVDVRAIIIASVARRHSDQEHRLSGSATVRSEWARPNAPACLRRYKLARIALPDFVNMDSYQLGLTDFPSDNVQKVYSKELIMCVPPRHTHTHALPTAPRPSPPPTHPRTHARMHARSHRRVMERGELRGKDGREGETHARTLGAVGAVHGDPCSARVGSRRGRFGCLAASLWTTRSSQRS